MCHNQAQGHTVGSQYPWERANHPPPTPDELLGLIVDNDNSADEAIMITSEDDIIITDNEIKKVRAKEKEDNTTRMNFMLPI